MTRYTYVTALFGNPGPIEVTGAEIDEILTDLEHVLGYRPVLTEREGGLWVRCYRDGSHTIVEGQEEFDYKQWLENPQWELVFEPC